MQPGNVLITGAAVRLGREMAISLAKTGWNIAVHYASSRDAAEQTAAELRDYGVRAETVAADLLDEAQIAALVPDAAQALGGPLSLLINNASIFEHDVIETATQESWDRHMMSNLRAPFVLTQEFAAQAPEIGEDADGRPVARACVVNMVDMRVRKLTPHFMTYTLAKSALWAFTQTAAQGLAPRIRVNAIGPGPTLKGVRQSEETYFCHIYHKVTE